MKLQKRIQVGAGLAAGVAFLQGAFAGNNDAAESETTTHMPDKIEQRYQERLKRYVTAMRNEKPDRIPIRPFVASNCAMSNEPGPKPKLKRRPGVCIPWEDMGASGNSVNSLEKLRTQTEGTAVNPATPKTEPPPSTQLRKAVSGGSLKYPFAIVALAGLCFSAEPPGSFPPGWTTALRRATTIHPAFSYEPKGRAETGWQLRRHARPTRWTGRVVSEVVPGDRRRVLSLSCGS